MACSWKTIPARAGRATAIGPLAALLLLASASGLHAREVVESPRALPGGPVVLAAIHPESHTVEILLGADGAEPLALALPLARESLSETFRPDCTPRLTMNRLLSGELPAGLGESLAWQSLLAGQPRRALTVLEALPAARRSPSRAGLVEGITRLWLGQHRRGRRLLERALAAAPRCAACWTARGVAAALAGDVRAAGNAWRRASALAPELFSPRFNLGMWQWRSGERLAAARLLRRARMSAPRAAPAYLYEGLAWLAAEHPVAAVAALSRARELGLTERRLFVARGLALQQLQLHELAAADLDRAFGLPGSAHDDSLADRLARSLVALGRNQRAGAVLVEQFSRRPRTAQDHFLLGLKLLLIEQPRQATRYLLRAVAMGRRVADGYYALGQALLQSGLPGEALRALKLAEMMEPDSAEIRFSLAVALFQSGDRRAALERLRRAEQLAPADTDVLQLLAEFALQAHDFQECQRAARRLIDLAPERLPARFTLAQCLAEGGQLAAAREAMEDALDHDSGGNEALQARQRLQLASRQLAGRPGPLLLLALIHERRGDWSEAVRALERFVLVAPDADWTRWAVSRLQLLLRR